MARIEKREDVKAEIEKMKGEVVKEVRRGPRKRRPKLACSLLFLGFVGTFISWMLWIVAGTGLVQIPFFTNLAYTQPEPARVVEPGVSFEQVVQEQFQTTLAERVQAGGGTLQDKSVRVVVSEESLTTTLRSAIEELNIEIVQSDGAQISIHEGSGFRLFVPISNSPQQTALEVFLRAQPQEGALSVVLESVELGSVGIPTFIISSMLGSLLDRYVAKLNEAVSLYATIDELRYQEGSVEIFGTFAVEFVQP